jgi:hypothetical protein
MEMGPCIRFIRGLRVSRLLDLRGVSGSKSDTPTRAKNFECMITKGEGKNKLKKNTGDSRQKTRRQRSEPQRTAGILEGWRKKNTGDRG